MVDVSGYLDTIARDRVPAHLRAKLDANDIVQDVLIKIHQARGKLEGRTEAETVSFLRKVFETTLADHIRRFDRAGRRASLERSLGTWLDDSAALPPPWLAAEQTSPSGRARRKEQLLRLAEALGALPENQRRAVELHHLKRLSLKETAAQMGISNHAAAGLIRRGLDALRERLGEDA
jgi:RNA polymerase sigma-70 factor (ECF subfamily)